MMGKLLSTCGKNLERLAELNEAAVKALEDRREQIAVIARAAGIGDRRDQVVPKALSKLLEELGMLKGPFLSQASGAIEGGSEAAQGNG